MRPKPRTVVCGTATCEFDGMLWVQEPTMVTLGAARRNAPVPVIHAYRFDALVCPGCGNDFRIPVHRANAPVTSPPAGVAYDTQDLVERLPQLLAQPVPETGQAGAPTGRPSTRFPVPQSPPPAEPMVPGIDAPPYPSEAAIRNAHATVVSMGITTPSVEDVLRANGYSPSDASPSRVRRPVRDNPQA